MLEIKVTDKMVDVLNNLMDSAEYAKDEIKVFETYKDLAAYLYENNLAGFLADLEEAEVMDDNLTILENFFYEYPNIIEDGSYGWIFLLQ